MRLPVLKYASLRWMVLGQCLLLGGVTYVVSRQIERVKDRIAEMADLKDPSPFTSVLSAQLSQMNFGLLSYLHTHDAGAAQSIRQAEELFEKSLADFQIQNPRMLPLESKARISNAFIPLRKQIDEVLRIGDAQRHSWEQLLNRQDQALSTLNFRLKPLVKKHQARAGVRQDLILSMASDLRQIPEQLTRVIFGSGADAGDTLAGSRRFEKFVNLYRSAAITPAEKRDIDEVSDLWRGLYQDAQDILSLENQKSESLNQFSQDYHAVLATISKTLPAVRPEEIIQRKDAIFGAIQRLIAGAALLVLGALAACIWTALLMYRRIRRGLDEIRAVTEAAATGDLSKEVDVTSARDVGGMGTSVNRLIGSLRRSQQLIVQLGTIVESTGDASIGLTLEGAILSWNHGAQRLYEYTLEEVKGQSVEMLFPKERQVQFAALAHELGRQRSVWTNTIHRRKNGALVNVRLIMNRITDTQGKTIGISLVSRELAFEVPSVPGTGDSSAKAA